MIRGRDRERVLTRKVVKERTLRHAGTGAEIVNGRCGIAFLADDRDGRVEKLAARTAPRGRLARSRIHIANIPTGRYVVKIKGPDRRVVRPAARLLVVHLAMPRRIGL